MALQVTHQTSTSSGIATRFISDHCAVEHKLCHDISKGKEFYPISIVNGVDKHTTPSNYSYVTENCETKPVNIDRTITSLQSCRCEDNCTSQSCICATISIRCWYDANGRLAKEFNFSDPPMIFECNRACECWQTCSNRVVANRSRCRLQVYRSPKNQGWSVRTLRDIARGTFVCEYVGELITDQEAEHRQDDSYLFDLDHRVSINDQVWSLNVTKIHFDRMKRFCIVSMPGIMETSRDSLTTFVNRTWHLSKYS